MGKPRHLHRHHVSIYLGTSAAATSPQRSGEASTGLFSANSGQVSIAATGTDEADFTSTGLNLPVATESYKINGNNAHWQDDINFNLAIGNTALPTTLSQAGGGQNGQTNMAVGYQALNANTIGGNDTALGASALSLNTTGINNVAIGHNALLSNSTGSYNIGIGFRALQANTTGINNIAIGYASFLNSTTASSNTIIGYGSMWNATTGNNNTALGLESLYNRRPERAECGTG